MRTMLGAPRGPAPEYAERDQIGAPRHQGAVQSWPVRRRMAELPPRTWRACAQRRTDLAMTQGIECLRRQHVDHQHLASHHSIIHGGIHGPWRRPMSPPPTTMLAPWGPPPQSFTATQ
ncbi:hypothetical protein GWK47_051725 [Chionoecetes opilio]|uniref:Uncharacterized protein n=1 Tax=Chionoecetes opilio TaxID=41210 RepID=A0A8J5CT30_CHIOP|nr:hypothetical protein GWK47_051725 [Chionoecetes opilio]